MIAYPDSVQYLYSLGNEVKTIKMGLKRITALLERMGNPQHSFRAVHVAGTNGKGSVCAMVESGLRASGVRTGLNISPHLVEPTERIQINGRQVSPEEFAASFNRVHAAALSMVESGGIDGHPTYFETVTAMAFDLFRENRVEMAVVEVGLGGRLDATNVLSPALCVITPIDFDHESWLGHSIPAIASEKAGILKPGLPAVISAQRPEALPVLEERGAVLHHTRDWEVHDVKLHARGCRYRVSGDAEYEISCGLAGAHQVQNSLTAAVALHHLGVPRQAIESGVTSARWPGRLERVAESPEVILDGAHNPAGIRALADYIREFYSDRRVWLVYGTMRDKSVGEIGELLSPLAHEIVLTAADSSRAVRPEALAELFDHPRIRLAKNLSEALEKTSQAGANDAIFITGSLFLVGEARARFLP
jgi:dihydrofolate synthase/folylpolyglutamate synthase